MCSALSLPSDPISPEGIRLRTVHVAGSVLTLTALTWALWPIPPDNESAQLRAQVTVPKENPPEKPTRETPYPAEAFRVVLWPPTASGAADQLALSTTQAPVKPPDYVLVAILSDPGRGGEQGGWEAVLYDPEQDRLRTVATGDKLGRFEVSRVDAEVVHLSDGKTNHELRLRKEEIASEGKGRG